MWRSPSAESVDDRESVDESADESVDDESVDGAGADGVTR